MKRLVKIAALASSLSTASLFFAQVASADILPEGQRPLKVAVTFSKPIDGHVVAFPTDCMGLDPKLNPHLEYMQNYDVVEPESPREPYKFCDDKTRIYVLDVEAFKKTAGEKVPAFVRSEWKLEELSKIKAEERAVFFQKNTHVHATGYAMPARGLVKEASPLAQVAETVTFGGLPARIQNVKLVYTYTDGQKEEHTYTPPARPQPKRAEARGWMQGLVDADASDAGAGDADASAGDAGTAAAPPPKLIDRKLFVTPQKHSGLGQTEPSATAAPARTKLGRSGKLVLVFSVIAAVAAGLALREEKKKG
jgi:hypothetical protein